MLNLLFLNDIHYSRRKPSSRRDDYGLSIREKLQQVGLITQKLEIDAVGIAGDLFHFPRPSQVSHEEDTDLIEIFRSYKAPVVGVAGNHDMSSAGMVSLRKQPLGALVASGVFKLLSDTPFDIVKNGIKVRMYGLSYSAGNQVRNYNFPRGDENVQIVLGHLPITPTGGYICGGPAFQYADFAACGFDIMVCGHIHTPNGVMQLQGKHFVNIGSLSRNTIHYDNRDRVPEVALVKISDSGKIDISRVALKVKPGSEVFDLEKKEESEEEQKQIMEFLENLGRSSSTGVVYADELKSMNLSDEILSKVNFYIQEAESEETYGEHGLKEVVT